MAYLLPDLMAGISDLHALTFALLGYVSVQRVLLNNLEGARRSMFSRTRLNGHLEAQAPHAGHRESANLGATATAIGPELSLRTFA